MLCFDVSGWGVVQRLSSEEGCCHLIIHPDSLWVAGCARERQNRPARSGRIIAMPEMNTPASPPGVALKAYHRVLKRKSIDVRCANPILSTGFVDKENKS